MGLTFGADNTFWGKANGLSLLNVSYSGSTGTTLANYAGFPLAISPIGVSAEMNLLAGIGLNRPENLQLYDLTLTNGAPVLIAQTNFATANTNAFGVGAVDFGNDRVYALDSNNGILAMKIIPTVAPVFFEKIVQIVDGRVQINGSGNPGSTNSIQRSTDLVNWTTLTTFLNTNGSWQIVDDNVPNAPQGYYRASQ